VLPVLLIIGSLGIVLWKLVNRHTSRGGDPHGRILRALEDEVPRSLPPGTKILSQGKAEPTWDSCDGRRGTFGWDPAQVVLRMNGSAPAELNRSLTASGWKLVDQLGPTRSRWSHMLFPGQPATLDVTTGQTSGTLDLVFAAQPPGPVVRGC
jgi:hypothetical protein